jgi:hypothetical protein
MSAQGFVRPVRRSYRHAGCDTITTLDDERSEAYARWPKFYPKLYGAAWCDTCRMHRPVGEFVWTADGKVVGS